MMVSVIAQQDGYLTKHDNRLSGKQTENEIFTRSAVLVMAFRNELCRCGTRGDVGFCDNSLQYFVCWYVLRDL